MLPTSSQYVYVTDSNNIHMALPANDQESVQILTPVEITPSDSSAPILSNKNPLRLVANNGQFIPLETNGNTNVQRVVQILNTKNIAQMEGPVSINYDNKNILCNVIHASRNQFIQSPNVSQATSQSSAPRRRGRRPGRKNKTRDDDDPDYVPDLPDELIAPYPTQRSPSSGQTSVYSDRNYDQEYYDHSEPESDSSSVANDFICEICSRAFHNKAGLSRHNMLKHSGKVIAVGPKVDPARRAQLRYDNLKSALERASANDIIELAAPYVASLVPMWHYLFYRTEFANKTTDEIKFSNLPMPPPDMPSVVAEYLGFINEFRTNFPSISQRIKAAKRPASASIDDTNLEDVGEEIDESLLESFGPGPTSVKRKRYLAFKRNLESSMDGTGPITSGDIDGNDQGVVEVKDAVQSCVLGVISGRYKTRSSFPLELLPPRYSSFAPETDASGADGYPEIVNLDEVGNLKSKQPQRQQQQQQQLRPQSQKENQPQALNELNANETDEIEKTGPKKAMIIAGVHPETIDMVQDVTDTPGPENEEGPQASNEADAPVGDGHEFNGPIPEELITNGTFIPMVMESGESSDYVYHYKNGYVYNRKTGRLAREDEVKVKQNLASEQTVYVQALTETMSMLTMPDGTQVQVQHGPEGVTPEVFNMVLQQLTPENNSQ